MTRVSFFAGAAFALGLATVPALAEIKTVASAKPVAETMDALVAAVEGAGATVFARVNHGAGAMKVEMELAAAELLIFGNPKLGTPALQDDIQAGLQLPLKVLVYADGDGKTWLSYETPDQIFDGLNIAADAPYLAMMSGALGKLTAKAAE